MRGEMHVPEGLDLGMLIPKTKVQRMFRVLRGKALWVTAAGVLVAAACADMGLARAQDAGQPESMADKLKNWFTGGPAKPGPTTGADAGPPSGSEPACPPVDVRQGASTITVYGPGEQAATNVRYQATVADMARECTFRGGSMTLKVGMQGRVILGPVATPGKLELPLRIALVQEGPEPKTLWTKLYKVPVTVAAGQPNVPFVHVEQDLTVPKPSSDAAEAYVVYVGFDQLGKEDKGRKGKGAKSAKDASGTGAR